jgi:hypothetical protein
MATLTPTPNATYGDDWNRIISVYGHCADQMTQYMDALGWHTTEIHQLYAQLMLRPDYGTAIWPLVKKYNTTDTRSLTHAVADEELALLRSLVGQNGK